MALNDLSQIEKKIITAFLDSIEAANAVTPFRVRVYGEGEMDYDGVFSRGMIEAHIGNCDDTTISVEHGNCRGNVFFVHGNDEDVITNMSGNSDGYDLIAALLKSAEAIAMEVV